MSLRQKVAYEIQELAVTLLYFSVWFGVLVVIKHLVLAEYHIKFGGLSLVLLAALVVAKVVLVLEHVTLGQWAQSHPAVFDVILRTLLYSLGVFVVLLLETSFEARHEYGGFASALALVFQHPDMPHVWANTICVAGALLAFDVLSILRRRLGKGELVDACMAAPPS